MKRISMLYLLLLLGTSLVYSQTGQTLSPQEIRDKMVSVYASCSSYADQGQVETTYFIQSRVVRSSGSFATAFVRPSRFRFEIEDRGISGRGSRYTVWRDESDIKSWWTIKPETRYFETLVLALAGATGVSGGSAISVPSMLMGNLGDRIQTLTQLKLAGQERIEDKAAYRIQGRDWQNNLLTIWIDKESFLLLRIHERKTIQDGYLDATTTYQPQINTNISPEKLAFNH